MHSNLNNAPSFLFAFLTLIVLFFSAGLYAQNNANVHFKTDQSSLLAQEIIQLKKLYNEDLSSATSIQLIGHTDADGSDGYNEQLSKRRVEFVREQLIEMGCATDKISVDFKGEKKPLNTNGNAEEKKQNRRVEILWQKPEPIAAGSIQELYDLLEQEKQTFCINPNRDTLLILNQGTIIVVPAGSFKTQSNECVLLKTKEIYKYSDMIMENLSTTSNGRLLETAGMVYTEATDQDGNRLDLNFDAEITIMIPTDTLREDMKLFTGQRDSETNQMNWNLAGNNTDFSMYNYGHDIEWCNPENYIPETPQCEKCGLFCRVGRLGGTLKGATDEDIKAENKEFRKCQKSLRKKRKPDYRQLSPYPYRCVELMEKYGVTTYEELEDTLVKLQVELMKQREKEFEKYGVSNYEDYRDTLRKIEIQKGKIQFEQTAEKLKTGKGSVGDLKYYVARVNTLGWINCDAFTRFPANEKIVMKTDVPFNDNFDCKLVFRDRKSIMRSDRLIKYYSYSRIPPDFDVWLMALKYVNGQAYVSLHETTTRKKAPASEFRAVSIEELRQELKKLDH